MTGRVLLFSVAPLRFSGGAGAVWHGACGVFAGVGIFGAE